MSECTEGWVEASPLPGVKTPVDVCPGSLPRGTAFPLGLWRLRPCPLGLCLVCCLVPCSDFPSALIVPPHRLQDFLLQNTVRSQHFPPHALSWSPVPTEERLLPSTGTLAQRALQLPCHPTSTHSPRNRLTLFLRVRCVFSPELASLGFVPLPSLQDLNSAAFSRKPPLIALPLISVGATMNEFLPSQHPEQTSSNKRTYY